MNRFITGSSLLALLFLSPTVQAANKWWDVNGATPGSGQGTNTGTWNTGGVNWTTDSIGSSATTTFATGDVAIFSAGTDATNAFTISVPSALTAGGITVEEGSVSLTNAAVTNGTGTVTIDSGAKLSIPNSANIAASAGATLVLNGGTIENTSGGIGGSFVNPAMVITLNGGGIISGTATGDNFTIIQTGTPGTTISGTGPLIKAGAGVIAIATACAYSGATIITNGELRIRSTANRLPVTTAVAITNPGILNLNGVAQQIGSLTGNGTVGLGSTTLTVGEAGEGTSTVFSGTVVDVSSSGTGGVSSGHGSIIKQGSGTLTLSGVCTYSGSTTISAGTLALGAGGSINNTTSISINLGAVFDVSAQSSPYTLSTNTTLTATGNPTAATVIKGPSGGTVSLGSQAITLNFDGADSSLFISQGTLALNSNAFTINKASTLAAGTYTVIQQFSGNISDLSGTYPTPTGTAIGAGTTAAISVSGKNVVLTIKNITSTGVSSSTGGTSTYGQPVTFSATVSGSDGGGTVAFYLDGSPTPIPGCSAIPLTGGVATTPTITSLTAAAHTISAVYSGDPKSLTSPGSLAGGQTVNPLAVILMGTRPYDGTVNAASTNLSVSNIVGSDDVNVASGSGSLASASVGTNAITSVGSLALGGTTATNYTLSGANGSMIITDPGLPFSIISAYIDNTGANFVTVFQSIPGDSYQLMGSTNLVNWTNTGNPITAATVLCTNNYPYAPDPFGRLRSFIVKNAR